MMVSPESYITERLKNAPYPELIREREELIEFIRNYEKNEAAGDRSDPSWNICPKPDVQYQVNLMYLSALCSLMEKRYNQDYVWGNRSFPNDCFAGR